MNAETITLPLAEVRALVALAWEQTRYISETDKSATGSIYGIEYPDKTIAKIAVLLPPKTAKLFMPETTPPSPRETMNGKPIFRVPVKTVINLESGFAPKLLCDGPTLSMGDACVYECSFCYVPSMLARLGRVREILEREGLKHEDVVIIREAALDVLRGQLLNAKGGARFSDPNDRRTIYSSPLDDVAGNMDLVRATVEACALILEFTRWRLRLLSKSTLLPKLAALLIERTRGTFATFSPVRHPEASFGAPEAEGRSSWRTTSSFSRPKTRPSATAQTGSDGRARTWD